MTTFNFSGHESFPCRQFWLKKGFDFVNQGRDFNQPDAVVHLGVGKNMVRSIRFWLKAFDVLSEDGPVPELFQKLFEDDGWDPFIEDTGTLWLLHYLLLKKEYASIYRLLFAELRKRRPEFSRQNFIQYVGTEKDVEFTEGTLKTDFSVFTRTYYDNSLHKVDEGYSALLADLNLLTVISPRDKEPLYRIENRTRPVPYQIVFYAILDNKSYQDSISFDSLYLDPDGPGTIFALDREGLVQRLDEIAARYPKSITYKSDPLIRELQFKDKRPKPLSVLSDYYRKNS